MPVPGKGDSNSDTGSIEIELTTDRRGAEVLSLELRMLAKTHGLEIESLTVAPTGADTIPPERDSSP